MDYKEVKQKLKKEFTKTLKPFGYKAKSVLQGCTFVLINEDTVFTVGYGLEDYVDEFKTGLFGSIGIKQIQRIENVISGESENYDTLLLQSSQYFGNINYRFTITTDSDINEWLQIFSNFFSEFASPFFNKYKTITDIDKLLNTNPKERVPELDNLEHRIIKGLISSRLNNNPNYPQLKEFYQSEVETKLKGHFLYNYCNAVISFLDKNPIEMLLEISSSNKNSS
jgi:hypothetical protein